MKNIAFIDWQNLYMWLEWKLDFQKFRKFLKKRFNVDKAYYFLWFKWWETELYRKLQEAGFILVFNEKPENLKSDKKWNIDVCLVFYAMRSLQEEDFNKIVVVSGDWDFKIMIDHFLSKWKFERILFPNKKYASSLYKQLSYKYTYLLKDIKHLIIKYWK
jgi:hypothetical protein